MFLPQTCSRGVGKTALPLKSGSEQSSSGGSHALRLKVSEIFWVLGVMLSLAGRLRSVIIMGLPVTIGEEVGGLTNAGLSWAVKKLLLSSSSPPSMMHDVRLPSLVPRDFCIMGKT